MAKGRLFEAAILYHPKAKQNLMGEDITEPSIIVKAPTIILAESDKAVGMQMAREIPQEYENKFDGIEIAIRPF